MKSKLLKLSILSIVSGTAFANTGLEILNRCETDSLAPPEAVERTEWWLKCRPQEFMAVAALQAGEALSEDDARAQIRSSFLYNRSGALRPRPMYISFIGQDAASAPVVVVAPVDRNADCGAIPATAIGDIACTSSCYKPEMRLLFKDGYNPILGAFEQKLPFISVVSKNSTLSTIKLKNLDVQSYTESVEDSLHKIRILKTASGGILKVTENHPLLNEAGKIQEASLFEKGQYLLKANGSKDKIVSAATEDYFGKVYNVAPRSLNKLENIVIAEGFLSGSSWYQNDGVLNMNRTILRANLPKNLVN